jgi:hypothetical protein
MKTSSARKEKEHMVAFYHNLKKNYSSKNSHLIVITYFKLSECLFSSEIAR